MKKIFFLVLAIFGLYIFRSWFSLGHLGGFDLPFFYHERLKEFGLLPRAWDSGFGDGIGDSSIKYLWIETYLRSVVSIFVNRLNLPWELVLRLFWLWPYLALALFSPYFFLKKILPGKNPLFLVIGVLVYSFNTYVLLLVSGGQMNLAIAYMLAPIVLWSFIKQTTDNRQQITEKIRNSIATGLVLAVQVLFDLRMAYVTMIAVGIYFLIQITVNRKQITKDKLIANLTFLTVTIVITACLHAFWLLPQVMTKTASLPPGYDNPGWLSFLSWAPFSQTISLLHPNWPENIFGKVYFMRPEFLGIPILTFSSLLFIAKSKIKYQISKIQIKNQNDTQNSFIISQYLKIPISFFVVLGLLGAFLAKGVNGPFGEIYYWLFSHVPFFYLFRDPTKFYLLVAIAYMVLIPYSFSFLTVWINEKIKNKNEKLKLEIIKYLSTTIVALFIIYWLFLLWPVLSGQVKGTLVGEKIPYEYSKLEQLFSSDKKFSRTLWVPTTHRLSYITSFHPAVPAAKLLDTTDQDKILHLLGEASVSAKLRGLAVGYVVIPYDFNNEIFLTKRRYDDNLRKNVKEQLDKLSYLSPILGFNNLAVYRLTGGEEHFWIENSKQITDNKQQVEHEMINPTKYEVKIQNAQRGDLLVFSERFDRGWKAQVIESKVFKVHKVYKVESIKYDNLLNSFVLPETGSYTLKVFYEPQKWVVWGSYISLVTLALSLAVLLVLHIAKGG